VLGRLPVHVNVPLPLPGMSREGSDLIQRFDRKPGTGTCTGRFTGARAYSRFAASSASGLRSPFAIVMWPASRSFRKRFTTWMRPLLV
jgi:hypothetical protein